MGASLYGLIASDMKERPINRILKPTRISPIFFFFSDFVKSTRNAPIPKSSGAKNSGFITLPHSLMETIHAVMVVPILAPMITPTAWASSSIPAFTKPTTITVVAEELCMIAVTPAPTRIAISLFFVRKPISFCIFPPADF